eukprot:2239093-Pyramimonas_sp.AAC.1
MSSSMHLFRCTTNNKCKDARSQTSALAGREGGITGERKHSAGNAMQRKSWGAQLSQCNAMEPGAGLGAHKCNAMQPYWRATSTQDNTMQCKYNTNATHSVYTTCSITIQFNATVVKQETKTYDSVSVFIFDFRFSLRAATFDFDLSLRGWSTQSSPSVSLNHITHAGKDLL